MVARIVTWAFDGVEARRVDVQVQITDAINSYFGIVGLADKAVGESRDRVRASFAALGLALPLGRIIVNLAPADLPKEGSHYDAPIALALLVAIGVLPSDSLDGISCIGELGLDGSLPSVVGALPAAVAALASDLSLVCPAICGPEAAWGGGRVLAIPSIMAFINHVRGLKVLAQPERGALEDRTGFQDICDVRGQELAKRALEIAASGAHNMVMMGPPGSGKSMLAARLPGLLPPLTAKELLDVSMIHSVAGLLERGSLTRSRPFRAPHCSASMAALVGGGPKARPGEASLAHHGVLFLDELPEFSTQALDALRQPLETGEIVVARANRHVVYPARFQLIAAMNPCRCGGGDSAPCRKGPRCAIDYQSRVSGPMMDRIDLNIDVPAVLAADLALPPAREGSAQVAKRVAAARLAQRDRAGLDGPSTNSALQGEALDRFCKPDAAGQALLSKAAEAMRLTARAYHRTLKVARTIADLEGRDGIARNHIAEALSYRRIDPGSAAPKAV